MCARRAGARAEGRGCFALCIMLCARDKGHRCLARHRICLLRNKGSIFYLFVYFLIVTEESPKPFPLSVLWNFQYILNNFFSVLLLVLPLFLGSRHVSLGWVPKADSPGVQEEGGACVQRAGARCQWAGGADPAAGSAPPIFGGAQGFLFNFQALCSRCFPP